MTNHANLEVERMFLAAVPDADAAARIHRLATVLKKAHGFAGRLIPADRLHVSLFFLGGLHGAEVRAACEAAAETAAIAPFEVSFDRTASFSGKPGNHPLVLFGEAGVGKLRSFRDRLAAAMTQRGLRRRASTNFAPHVTLFYSERRVEEYPIEAICWTVREFVLIRSNRGHACLARWPLGVRRRAS